MVIGSRIEVAERHAITATRLSEEEYPSRTCE